MLGIRRATGSTRPLLTTKNMQRVRRNVHSAVSFGLRNISRGSRGSRARLASIGGQFPRYLGNKSSGDENETSDTKNDVEKSPESDGGEEKDSGGQQSLVAMDEDYDDYEYEEPRTAADAFNNYFVLGMQLLFIGGLMGGAFYMGKELFPGRLNPNGLYSEAYEILRKHDDVVRICGEDMRAFGRDTGSESRRNHIDSRKYVEADGSERVRIRFNIKGGKGHVKVWAEASSSMGANEWVYLIVQNQRTGKVMTIEDERDRLQREMLLNKTDDTTGTGSQLTDALSNLVRGGGGGASGTK